MYPIHRSEQHMLFDKRLSRDLLLGCENKASLAHNLGIHTTAIEHLFHHLGILLSDFKILEFLIDAKCRLNGRL